MRNLTLAFGMAWALFAHAAHAHAITLEQAMRMAARHHPQTRIAELRVRSAAGSAEEQATWAYNPVVSLEPQRRRLAGGGQTNDYYLSISQGLETAGKRGYRRAAAREALKAAKAEAETTRLGQMLDAASACVDLFYADRALRLHRQVANMYRQLVVTMKRRHRAGESSRLDVNLAQAARASALNTLARARQAWRQRQAAFYAAIGRIPEDKLVSLPPPESWPAPPTQWAQALHTRPDIQTLRLRSRQAESRMKEAAARRIPDIEVSAMVGREAGDRLVKLGLSVPLPLLNTHRGAWRAAVAERERIRTELEWRKKRLRFEVESAMRNARETERAARMVLDSSVIEDSRNAIRLARQAWEAGELEPEEMVFRIRQAVDAIVSSLETLRLAWQARIQLARAFGRPDLIIQGVTP